MHTNLWIMFSGIISLPTKATKAIQVECGFYFTSNSTVYSCQGPNTSKPAADKYHADVMSKQIVQMNQ